MTDPLLVPGLVYGLRTWTVAGPAGAERLTGPQRGTPWPVGGALAARCEQTPGHAAPAPGCRCGIHAFHPRPAAARRLLQSRSEVAGIVAAWGSVEVHEDGLRAQHARPHALFETPRSNPALIRRLAAVYGGEVVAVGGPDDILEHCRAAGLGLAPDVVGEILGPAAAAETREIRRAVRRRQRLVAGAAAAATAAMLAGGLLALKDPPGERVLHGRAGEVVVGGRSAAALICGTSARLCAAEVFARTAVRAVPIHHGFEVWRGAGCRSRLPRPRTSGVREDVAAFGARSAMRSH